MSNEWKAVPVSCRQRLAAEGKPYPRSSCAACGQLSTNWRECESMLARPACQPSALAQPNDQNPRGPRELFQKWVLSIEHPVKGWLDGHWLRRGDDREGYADEYVQGLWVAFKAFGAQPADQQGEPVMRLEAEKLWGGDGEYSVDFVKPGWLKECREKGGTFLLYARAQPATAKVVLPERMPTGNITTPHHDWSPGVREGWNACLDEVAKLNTPQ